jgi:hypothetical protein
MTVSIDCRPGNELAHGSPPDFDGYAPKLHDIIYALFA